jgi:surface antigen/peptidoglycan hydrolase CwlO-like protein
MSKKIVKFSISRRVRLPLTMVALAGLISTGAIAHADQYDNQISALQTQNTNSQSAVNSLQSTASSYQDAINQLYGQVSSLESAISINQDKQSSLQQQISADQAKISQEKSLLGDVIKSMYVNGQLTTIEELATSKSLSDYVDQEENQTNVQDKLNDLINQIAALQVQQQQQKSQLDVVVKSEQQQSDQLAADQAQQQQMLSYNEGQQATYNQQISANQSQINALRAEQIIANRRLVSNGGGKVDASGSCGGGYPATATNSYGSHWGCDYSLDNTIDNFGMYNRECVSYTAWKVYQTYGYMPYWGGKGNANEWPANARAAGIPTGSTPKVGSVAIYMGGSGDPYGHAMWVVGVDGNMITVDQYNLYYDGNYYQTTISAAGLTYIYFGG